MVTKYVILIPVRRLAIFGFAFLMVLKISVLSHDIQMTSKMSEYRATYIPVFI